MDTNLAFNLIADVRMLFQEQLGIPQTEEVAVLLAAGYEKFTPDAPTRKTAEDVLRFV